MERKDTTPKSPDDKQAFFQFLEEQESEVGLLLKSGEAYLQDERDKNNQIKTFKVFRNDGELLYFKDVEGLENYYRKSRKEV